MDLSCLNGLDVTIFPNAELRNFTTFKLGGICPAVIECPSSSSLRETVIRLRDKKVNFLLMGFGSNILASDHGIDLIMVRCASEKPLFHLDHNTLWADAAALLDNLAGYTVDQGLSGLLSMSGIPGTVAGAIAGNAGAYGEHVSDNLICVTVLKTDNSLITIPKADICFNYRDSSFKYNKNIILSAEFNVAPAQDPEQLKARRREILETRECKHSCWKDTPCAGSFFRNVKATSSAGPRQAAGWFLEQAGTKPLRIGGAHSYEKHANIITRDEGATAQDVYDLTVKMQEMVKTKFNIELVREVRMLGKFDRAAECDPQGYW